MLLLDFLAYLATPCSWRSRRSGLLTSSLQVQARYRRCRTAWQPHLERTRSALLAASEMAARRRTALLIGAGMLHDVPLAEFARSFEQVLLADVVFPWSTRLATRRWRNVRLIECDFAIQPGACQAATQRPAAHAPAQFLEDERLDFTASLNVLTQLPIIPRRLWQSLGANSAECDRRSRDIQQAHLSYLAQLPGQVALITDTAGFFRDGAGDVCERWDNLHGLRLPRPDLQWEWSLAPAPEADPRLDHLVEVAAFLDWKTAQQRPRGEE